MFRLSIMTEIVELQIMFTIIKSISNSVGGLSSINSVLISKRAIFWYFYSDIEYRLPPTDIDIRTDFNI
jgi:hypothetical protein